MSSQVSPFPLHLSLSSYEDSIKSKTLAEGAWLCAPTEESKLGINLSLILRATLPIKCA